jgi:hypothetical protein
LRTVLAVGCKVVMATHRLVRVPLSGLTGRRFRPLRGWPGRVVVPEVVAAGFGVDGVAGILGVIMAEVDHYWIAEQLVGESVQGAGTMSGREVAKAQVHATLALVETLRGISADLVVIRQAAQIMSAGAPPTA